MQSKINIKLQSKSVIIDFIYGAIGTSEKHK